MNTAHAIENSFSIVSHAMVDNQYVIETPCSDYHYFASLPQVVNFEGRMCVKTGWSSDTNRACYKSGLPIAHKVK